MSSVIATQNINEKPTLKDLEAPLAVPAAEQTEKKDVEAEQKAEQQDFKVSGGNRKTGKCCLRLAAVGCTLTVGTLGGWFACVAYENNQNNALVAQQKSSEPQAQTEAQTEVVADEVADMPAASLRKPKTELDLVEDSTSTVEETHKMSKAEKPKEVEKAVENTTVLLEEAKNASRNEMARAAAKTRVLKAGASKPKAPAVDTEEEDDEDEESVESYHNMQLLKKQQLKRQAEVEHQLQLKQLKQQYLYKKQMQKMRLRRAAQAQQKYAVLLEKEDELENASKLVNFCQARFNRAVRATVVQDPHTGENITEAEMMRRYYQ